MVIKGKEVKGIMYINNLPATIVPGRFVIVRVVDAELWYYGTQREYERALEVAQEIGNGFVIQFEK